MNRRLFSFLLFLVMVALFLLACRTASLLTGGEVTPTRTRITRAAQRATFTPIPTETETPLPTDTPEPTETPVPTDEPTATRRPNTPRPPPTDTPVPPTNVPQPTATPTQYFLWTTNGNSSCEGGSDTESVITGKITANSKAAVGQRVQASSGPGGEPISDPNLSDNNGNYRVTLVCGGKACNGDFYIWMIDPSNRQISPFVKFNFSSGCRKGKQDFVKR